METWDGTSVRSPAEFNACFVHAQDRNGAPWAYLPAGAGGTFTDSGAHGALATYWLQVRGTSGPTSVRMFAAEGAGPPSMVAEAVKQCR